MPYSHRYLATGKELAPALTHPRARPRPGHHTASAGASGGGPVDARLLPRLELWAFRSASLAIISAWKSLALWVALSFRHAKARSPMRLIARKAALERTISVPSEPSTLARAKWAGTVRNWKRSASKVSGDRHNVTPSAAATSLDWPSCPRSNLFNASA